MPAVDRHPYVSGRLTVPPKRPVEVTTSDENELPYVTLGVSVAVAGYIQAVGMDDEAGQSVEGRFYVAAGVMFPCRLKQIKETGTTATGIVAWD